MRLVVPARPVNYTLDSKSVFLETKKLEVHSILGSLRWTGVHRREEKTTRGANYFTGEMLETTLYANYSTGGRLKTT